MDANGRELKFTHSRSFVCIRGSYPAPSCPATLRFRSCFGKSNPGTALNYQPRMDTNGRELNSLIRVHSRFFPAPLARLRSGSEAALLGPSREQCSATNREWIRRRFSSYGGQDFGELSRAATNGRELKFVHSRAFAVSILEHFK